ncbi:MAG: hypothetical protein F6K16_35380, partial [Symploca sp. SIO2B6]|nr:hypothetical protein [Symploca sp. SIO2B6]
TPSALDTDSGTGIDPPSPLTSPQQLDLFEDWLAPRLAAREQAIAEAYRRQGEAIAYRQ